MEMFYWHEVFLWNTQTVFCCTSFLLVVPMAQKLKLSISHSPKFSIVTPKLHFAVHPTNFACLPDRQADGTDFCRRLCL